MDSHAACVRLWNQTQTIIFTGIDANRKNNRERSGLPFFTRRQFVFSGPGDLPSRKSGASGLAGTSRVTAR